MNKIRVGVIRGGHNGYSESLLTGANIIKNLSSDRYDVRDILIDKSGIWHMHGIPSQPHDILSRLDIVINALHTNDGKIQHIFETHGIPFTGSGSFSSTTSNNLSISRDILKKSAIKTPQSILLDNLVNISKEAHEVFRKFPLPVVVRPSFGSGMTVAKGFPELEEAIKKTLEYSKSVMVEEYISGKGAGCSILDDFRGEELYAFPPVEIDPYKHTGMEEIQSTSFSTEQKKEIENIAKSAHKALGMEHYSHFNFVIHPKRGVFVVGTTPHPDLSEKSIIARSLTSVGASVSHFLEHIIGLAITRK